jgi:hypothetical protein
MQVLFFFLLLLTVGGYAAFSRFLVHRERMAALEAKRPQVLLQLPPGDLDQADRLTDEILAACKAKGIDVDLTVR